jgi:hypothetical protein
MEMEGKLCVGIKVENLPTIVVAIYNDLLVAPALGDFLRDGDFWNSRHFLIVSASAF